MNRHEKIGLICTQEIIFILLQGTYYSYNDAHSVHRNKTAIDGQVCFNEWAIADPVKHV